MKIDQVNWNRLGSRDYFKEFDRLFNERLFKFNIVDSPLCSLRGAYNESIKHLFCKCTVTQRLWDQLRSWLYKVISFPILEPKTVILGLPSETTSNYILINHIILLFKRFIFVKRKERKYIGFNGLKAFIKMLKILRIR